MTNYMIENDLLNNDLLNKIKDAIDKIKSNKKIICDIDLMYDDILLMKNIIEDKNKLKELNDLLISGNCICSFINEGIMIPKIIIESIENYH